MTFATFADMPRYAREHFEQHTAEREFPAFERWCNDPAYREQHARETQDWRDFANAEIDRGMARGRQAQLERWAQEERP